MASTTILDGIRIASPCQANWEEMKGDDRTRFCSACGKNVYNISAMTLGEATELIADREEMPCLRLYRRTDGTTLTSDCPVGSRSNRMSRFRRIAGLGLVGLTMASTGLTSLAGEPFPDDPAPASPNTPLNQWVDWVMIQLGLRKPRQVRLLGRPSMPLRQQPGLLLMGEPAASPIPTPPVPVNEPECGEEP